MEHNSNRRVAWWMMMVGLILLVLAFLCEIASFVTSIVQYDRWPLVPTIVLSLYLIAAVLFFAQRAGSRK